MAAAETCPLTLLFFFFVVSPMFNLRVSLMVVAASLFPLLVILLNETETKAPELKITLIAFFFFYECSHRIVSFPHIIHNLEEPGRNKRLLPLKFKRGIFQ